MATPPVDLVSADRPLLVPGTRAIYVAHRQPGDWFLGAPGFVERGEAPARVPFEHLLKDDPSLREVCDLQPGWHAFRNGAGDPWWSSEIPRGDLFFLSFETRPTELLADRDGIGGAFVSSWVISASLAEARRRARAHLEETGWAIVATLREQAVARPEIPAESRAHVRQAEIDGEVHVIHAFPPDEPDA